MPNHRIKSFLRQEPNCVVCGRHVKGWGRAKCDNCGNTVCQRHRPLFQSYWQCPHCLQAQNQYITPPMPAGGATMEVMLQTAQECYDEARYADASALTDAIFCDLAEE